MTFAEQVYDRIKMTTVGQPLTTKEVSLVAWGTVVELLPDLVVREVADNAAAQDWLHGVLYDLEVSGGFRNFGHQWKERLGSSGHG